MPTIKLGVPGPRAWRVGCRRYRYIGDLGILQGHTALGQWQDGVFKVQVDDHHHIWAYHWHATDPNHWEDIECSQGCDTGLPTN